MASKGAQALMSLHYQNDPHTFFVVVKELLYGTYTLLWRRTTLRTVLLEAQIVPRTSARRPRRESGL